MPACRLRLETVLWSAKPRPMQFTVFTQLTIDRLQTLYNQCTTFTGPVSAAVYLSLLQTDEQVPQPARTPALWDAPSLPRVRVK
jgi:hypothetical protein